MPQQPAPEYLGHGQIPFFRLGCADPRHLPEGARAVVLGVPTDAGTTYQPGARLAPWHVRRVSALVQAWHVHHALDPFEATGAVDGGNVVFPPFDRDAGRAAIDDAVANVVAHGAVPFLVGGDHTIALPALRAASRAHGPLTVIHVDAHLDTSGPEAWGDAWHHGTPIRHALDEGLVADGQLWQLAVRGPWGSATDGAPGDRHGARRVDSDALAAAITDVARDIRTDARDRPVWITFDVDAVDPAFAPGTGTPVPGGLTSREALALVRALAGIRLVGMDVVEVCPPLDHADVTSHLAAHLVYEGLALAAVGRRP